ASADPRTNQLFVQDIPSKLEEVRRILARLDVPSRQVLIEARVVVADDGFTREIGNRLGYYNSNPNGENIVPGRLNATVGGNYTTQPYYATGLGNNIGSLPTGLALNPNGTCCTGTITVEQLQPQITTN